MNDLIPLVATGIVDTGTDVVAPSWVGTRRVGFVATILRGGIGDCTLNLDGNHRIAPSNANNPISHAVLGTEARLVVFEKVDQVRLRIRCFDAAVPGPAEAVVSVTVRAIAG
jgi:hypothetical protein